MAFVRQKHKTDCGIAALAMLCDVSYDDAELVIPWRREGQVHGTTTVQLRVGGRKLGYRTESTPQARMKPLRGASWDSIPVNSLVKVPHPKDRSHGWHWVVWKRGLVFDPAQGVLDDCNYLHKPTSYMQFIKIEDPCPECGAELEPLWSGVKCPDCSYTFCY